MKPISVVIPTYNRCDTLKKALVAYLDQTALQSITEILVVDDGSTDSTRGVVDLISRESVVPIRYLRQENKGPAAARNVGIREAAGELILFTDDDIIPQRDLVAQHLEWHRKFPGEQTAVLGYVTWAPEIRSTPFMKWYGLEALFSYAELAGLSKIDYRYFYTCNISLGKNFLHRNGIFDEDFKVAAWEDIELGFRLDRAGMRLLYNPNAMAYHHQHISFEDACRRARKSAVALEVFKKKEAGQLLRTTSSLKRYVKRQLALPLSPLKRFIDSKLPLPWIIYRMMFRIYR